ncbi:MAG: neutral zinc metallopeptidase [Thermomicrobiales bacterium]|nr:neutral zinc metallopeptidase [Thermomicrobiales bacterium]
MFRGGRVVLAFFLLASLLPALSVQGSTRQDDADGGYADLLSFAVGAGREPGDIDSFWRGFFDRLETGQEYVSPEQLLGYDADNLPQSACIDPSEAEAMLNGAFYCPQDHVLGWDDSWLETLFNTEGFEYAPLAILAHEWGHHVQWLTGNSVTGLAAELQADCLASLYMGDALDRIGLTQEQYSFGLIQLFSLGNLGFTNSTWLDSAEHGSPAMRMTAVAMGLAAQGLDDFKEDNDPGNRAAELSYCDGYRNFERLPVHHLGPFAVTPLPGATVKHADGQSMVLAHPAASTTISFIDDVIFGTPAMHFERVRDDYFDRNPDARVRLIGEPLSVQFLSFRMAMIQTYERVESGSGPSDVTHGILVLDVLPRVGGLLVDISRDGEVSVDGDRWDNHLVHMVAIAGSICSPDDHGFAACLFSDLGALDLGGRELTVTATDDGIRLDSWVIEPGPTLVTFVNKTMIDLFTDDELPVASGFVFVKLTDDLNLAPEPPPDALPAPRREAIPEWFYDATMIGNPFTPGLFRQTQTVINLTPGQWVVVGYPFMTPISPPVTVTEKSPGSEPGDIATDAEIVMHDGGMSGFEDMRPGHQIWRVRNGGDAPHELLVYRFPDGTTDDEVLTWAEYWTAPLGTPPPSELDFDPDNDVHAADPFLAAVSGGQSVIVELTNLPPGTYAAFCFIPDQHAERGHWEAGEITVFTVGGGLRNFVAP